MTDVILTANIISSKTSFSPLGLHDMKHKPMSVKVDENPFPLITDTQLWVLPEFIFSQRRQKAHRSTRLSLPMRCGYKSWRRAQLDDGEFNSRTSQGRNRPKVFTQPLLKISVMGGTFTMGTHILSVITRPRNLEPHLSKSNFSGFSRTADDCNGSLQ